MPSSPITIAYIAKGAFDALNAAPELVKASALRHHEGELGFIDAVLANAEALESAVAGRDDELAGVFVYEAAEPFGTTIAERLLANKPVGVDQLAAELVGAMCAPPPVAA